MGFGTPGLATNQHSHLPVRPAPGSPGPGEQDAILLAESVKAERLIIDDLEGRREAANRGLPVIGTLGILAEAARRNLLDLPQALDALQATNFHVAPDLIKLLLANGAKRRK